MVASFCVMDRGFRWSGSFGLLAVLMNKKNSRVKSRFSMRMYLMLSGLRHKG